MEHILSQVSSKPWKLIQQFLPWTSSVIILNFLSATSLFCSSAKLTSQTQLLILSEVSLVPWVLITCVFSNVSYIEQSWGLRITTIFLRKWINHSLLSSLLAPFHKVLFLLTAWCCAECPKGLLSSSVYRWPRVFSVCLFSFCLWYLTINSIHGFILASQFIWVLVSLPFKVHGTPPVAGFNFAVQEVIVYSLQPLILCCCVWFDRMKIYSWMSHCKSSLSPRPWHHLYLRLFSTFRSAIVHHFSVLHSH